MPETTEAAVSNLNAAQAAELAQLVELEARWENLRKAPSGAREVGHGTQGLLGIQRAYDAFHSKLVAYNGRYAPAHQPELLLNTPFRLAAWCRSMRQLYLRLEQDQHVQCPVHLLEKAYRWAERVSVRLGRASVTRPAPPGTVRAAVQALEALGRWCDDLAGAAASQASPEAAAPS